MAILISLIDGSINRDTLIFLSLVFLTIFFIKDFVFIRFKPPSVVNSALFSGTIHIYLGLCFKTIFNISLVGAISKLIGIFNFFLIFIRSDSIICLLSSLKCIVTESAPLVCANSAALTGSG